MNYEKAKVYLAAIQADVDAASKALRSYPKVDLGLTPDHVKASSEWRADRNRYQAAFARLRAMNGFMAKNFKREMREERSVA